MISPSLLRRQLSIQGQVQGVGFRPFVYNLASQLSLGGSVINDGSGVEIEVQGDVETLERFQHRLLSELPPLAIIDNISYKLIALQRTTDFIISISESTGIKVGITPDIALCSDCRSELFNQQNRRYLHPFINCTNCGPRYTIVNRLPYDRVNIAMSEFPLCGHCDDEYHKPTNRRFHAQPVSCHECGPELLWINSADKNEASDGPIAANPIAEGLRVIQQGGIVAIKGIGGFHLACDARNQAAVEKLRFKKRRKSKPLAVMACNSASLSEICDCNASNTDLLSSQSAPIVILPKIRQCDEIMPGIAPNLNRIGVMLPYTPIHYLLFHAAANYPEGDEWLQQAQSLLLVMTSANASGEPLLIDNDETIDKISEIADGYLLHNRDIKHRCDDSVVHSSDSQSAIIRRGRGLAPQAVKLRDSTESILAVGAYLKNSICLSRENKAYLSPYIGDLDNVASCRYFEETIESMQQLFQIEPQLIVRDLHADFYSSQFAESLALKTDCEIIEVQHHHAHVAAVVAEHQLTGPVIGLALDGMGLGTDGKLWGGELLKLEGAGFERLGHFKPLPLPGGDKAAKEPWRLAAGILHNLGRTDEIESRFSEFEAMPTVLQMLRKQVNVPETSSAGRLFDAAAALLGVQHIIDYEAQAAMRLEALLMDDSIDEVDSGTYYQIDESGVLSFYPLLSALADESDVNLGAQLFHQVLVEALIDWVLSAVKETGIKQIVFSGGCFLNAYLRDQLSQYLSDYGLDVYQANKLSCNDSGLSLGQLWVAQQMLITGIKQKKLKDKVI